MADETQVASDASEHESGSNDQPTATDSSAKPAKKASAKKAPAKKAPAEKAPATETKALAKKSAAGPVSKFPRHSVERALRIPQAIYDQNAGNPATPTEAAKFTGGSNSGAFQLEVSSSKKYGFLESDGSKLRLTDRARQALAPQSANDRLNSIREAVLAAPDLSDVYNYYRGENLPDTEFFVNALTDRFKIPPDKVPEFTQIFDEAMESAELIDRSGERPRLLDIGRDETHKVSAKKSSSTPATPAGTTCFVMQPFGGALGGYYELIFKPAIKPLQLGLVTSA